VEGWRERVELGQSAWSVVENRRVAGGRVLQRHVLYLGNGARAGWHSRCGKHWIWGMHPKRINQFG
jgi:hypothetical protein